MADPRAALNTGGMQCVEDPPPPLWLPRYYGLSVWFPDVIKHLQADDYASKVKSHSNERIEDITFNFTLENQIHTNSVFVNDRYGRVRPLLPL